MRIEIMLQRFFGIVMAALGMVNLGWLCMFAETVGHGLNIGVMVFGLPLPAMALAMSSLFLIVVGLVVGYGNNGRQAHGGADQQSVS